MQITNKVLENNMYSLKNREIEQLVQFYTDNYNKVENHPDKKELFNNEYNEPGLERQREDVLNELLYYQAFMEIYNNARDVNSSRNFYIELRNLNKNMFNNYINIDNCIAEPKPIIYNDHNDSLEKLKAELERQERENKKKQPVIDKKFIYEENLDDYDQESYKDAKPSFDIEEHNRRLREKERMDKLKNDNDKLAQSLYTLEQQKRQLEGKVRDLEFQSNRSQYKQSQVRGTSALNKDYQTEGFQQVLRTKDEQIQTLQIKIDGLEKEHQRLAEKELTREPSTYRTNLTSTIKKSRRNNSYLKRSEYAIEPMVYSGRKYDSTGSEFVDHMYNNINRLLNKSNYKSGTREQSYAY